MLNRKKFLSYISMLVMILSGVVYALTVYDRFWNNNDSQHEEQQNNHNIIQTQSGKNNSQQVTITNIKDNSVNADNYFIFWFVSNFILLGFGAFVLHKFTTIATTKLNKADHEKIKD